MNMADYKTMYYELFSAVTKAIALLQETQRKTEEMFISSSDPKLTVVKMNEAKKVNKVK